MSTAALSVRSTSSNVHGRSSRKATNDFYDWEREALALHGDLEPEPSGGPLPRTVSKEDRRALARRTSALSSHSASNSGAAEVYRTTGTKPQLVGMVQPWDQSTSELEALASPQGSEPAGRSRPGSVIINQEAEPEGDVRDSLPAALSREGSKLSRRSVTSGLSHRNRATRGSGSGAAADGSGGSGSGGRSRKSSAQGETEGVGYGAAGDGQLGVEDEEGGGGGGSPPRAHQADQEAWESRQELLQRGEDGPVDGETQDWRSQQQHQHGASHDELGPADRGAASRVSKSERASRPPSIVVAPEPEASSGAIPSPKVVSRDGVKAPARTPSALSNRSGHSRAGGGGGGGSSRRQSTVPMELQDLPPEALPWSEPPEYVSRFSSTGSVNAPGVSVPEPQAPSQETSRASVRAPSTTPSNRSTGRKSTGGHGKPQVVVPMLPLRELAAANAAANGGNKRPGSAGIEQPTPPTPPAPAPPPTHPSVPIPAPPPAPVLAPSPAPPPPEEAVLPPPLSRDDGSKASLLRPASMTGAGCGGSIQKAASHRSMLDIPCHPLGDADLGSPAVTPSGIGTPLEPRPPQPSHESPRPALSVEGSRVSMRPASATSVNSIDRKTPFARKSAVDWHQELIEPLPWSAVALADFRAQFKKATFVLSDPSEEPLTARMDAVFALPPELWPVLPPGALYCLEASDPRVTFGYLQHCDFPDTKVRVATYFGKWSRQLVDFAVLWQPTPRAEAAWQLADGKQPPLPWEQRQVVAHTTNGEYQYGNTRMRFRGPKTTTPDAEMVEYSDAHGVDLTDTKAANETAPRNSDKDRDAHLIDPPRPNTWGELARRPLISNLRSRGGGTYVHHVNYDHSSLRTTCGRRVPAGYFFNLIPNAAARTPPVPGHSAVRSSSVGRSLAGGLRANGEPSSMRLRSVNGPVQALLSTFGDSISSSRWGAYVAGVSSVSVGAAPGSRPSSAGHRRPSSAVGGRLPHLQSSVGGGPGDLGAVRSASSSIGGFGLTGVGVNASASGLLQREGSRLAAPTSPTLVTLASKQRWRTYDVPFHHPIHSARAQELGTDMAVASGRGVRTFSDAAAVVQVAEQELRLARAFVPGPLVVPTWDDIPRLYAEHMEAARALMPVTELDMYATSKLHMLLYHLQCAATLEYDRLDAKLLLLPQMARMGRKSVEIDAWLQVLIEHAEYLYDKLEIHDRSRWRLAAPQDRQHIRRSVTFAKAAALSNPNASAWNFPDPLLSTSFASRSALNSMVQLPPPPPVTPLPAACISVEEWAAITRIMDTCRHAVLHDHWVRLRPVMTGGTQAGGLSSLPSSRAGSTIGAFSDACATASGEGDRLPDAQDPYSHGAVNRELLDYVHQDMEAMASPDFVPQPPTAGKKLKQRGYRGDGPLPPELVAEMPTVHRPVRCRGADETPLPPEFLSMDLWNVRHKAEQIDTSKASPDVSSPRDSGALRFSQVSVVRLQASKGFSDTRQAEIRRSMQRAKGAIVFDDSDVPEYGSDVADDDAASVATSFSIITVDGRPRRRLHTSNPIQKVEPVVPGIACQVSESDMPNPEEERKLEEARLRMLTEAEEARKLLLTGNGGRTRDQLLEDALKAAESAIISLKPRPIGATTLSEPDSPTTFPDGASMDTMDAAWRPLGRGPDSQNRGTSVISIKLPAPGGGGGQQDHGKRGQQQESSRNRGSSSVAETFGRGPEPFCLEKLNAEPSVMSEGEVVTADIPKPNTSNFGGVNMGVGGLVDYETAMARRRAIAGAEVALERSHFIPKSEVFNLFVTYCNLGGHPEQIEMLQSAVEAPVSTVTVSAVAKAVRATSRNATAGRMDVDSEATRQRIRGTAWLLGVTWRRVTNETYTSFLCRVLGWPAELTTSLHRTRATQMIARALIRGHDMEGVRKNAGRH